MDGDALRVTALSKKYGRFSAVSDVNLDVDSGCVVGLLGPNGSGKSSILHSLTGVVSPTGGTIEICGHPHDTPAAKKRLGFVPDDLALPTSLTGHEYLDLVKRLQPDADAELGEELVALFNLGHALGRVVAEYSHGMKRKIQMIAGILHRPGLLVLDEPFRGLDPEAHVILRDVIASFVGDGGGVLVATHDLAAAQGYCDEVTVVANGRTVAAGVPAALMESWQQRSLEGVFLAATGMDSRAQEVQERLGRLRLTSAVKEMSTASAPAMAGREE